MASIPENEKPSTIPFGKIEVPVDFFDDEISRPLNPENDGTSEKVRIKKQSLKVKAVVGLGFPGKKKPREFLAYSQAYRFFEKKVDLDGDVLDVAKLGPVAIFHMVNPTYRPAEVIIDFVYKTQWQDFSLGSVTFSFSGIVDGSKPTATLINVKDHERYGVDELWAFRLPVECQSIRTKINDTVCDEADSRFDGAKPSIRCLRDMYSDIHALQKTTPMESVVFSCHMDNNVWVEGLADRIDRGYAFQANLDATYAELFSKAPKSRLLKTDGFASLHDTEPEPLSTYFFTPTNRKVALGYSSYLDHKYEESQAKMLSKKDLDAIVFALPNMSKDKIPVGFLFAIRDAASLDLMPPVGTKVKLTVQLPYTMPVNAEVDVTIDEQKRRTTQHIRKGIQRLKGEKDPVSTLSTYMNQVTQKCDPKDPAQVKKRAHWIRAVSRMLQQRKSTWVEVGGQEKDDRRAGENVREQLDPVEAWVNDKTNWAMLRMPDTSACSGPLQWSGQRVALSKATEALGGALFYAELPLHPNWPKNLPKARVRYDLPLIDLQATMGTTVLNLPAKKQFKVNIVSDVQDDTLVARLEGINKFDSEPELASISQWHLNLDQGQNPVDFFKSFPFAAQVRDVLVNGEDSTKPSVMKVVRRLQKWDIGQLAAFRGLEHTDNGALLISGCPGSGKTEVCLEILHCTLAEKVDSKLLKRQVFAVPHTEWSLGDNAPEDATSQAERDNNWSTEPTMDNSWAAGGDWGTNPACDDKQTDASKSKLVSPAVLIIVGQNIQGDDIADRFNTICEGQMNITRCNSMPKEVKHIQRTGLAAPAGFDESALDFFNVSEAMRELDNISQSVKSSKSEPQLHGGNLSLTARVRTLIDSKAEFKELKQAFAKREKTPDVWERNKEQWADQVNTAIRLVVEDTQVMICTPVAARRLACKFPSFKPHTILLEEGGRMTEPDFMTAVGHFPSVLYIILSGDYLQIGPYVFSLLAHLVLLKEKIYDDEEGTKDADKDDPDEFEINNWGPQLNQSFLKRASMTDQTIHRLTVNWRSHYGIERLASSLSYGEQMISGYGNHEVPPEAHQAHRFIESLAPKAKGNILLIDVKDDKELQEGCSFSNHQHAEYIATLVADMFAFGLCHSVPTTAKDHDGKRARILIMSPYRAQVFRLKRAMSSLSKAEYCPELVDVRTIDTAMGDSADIVILDLTRSKRVGFTKDLPHLNVGLTRARFGLFIVGNGKILERRNAGPLKKVHTWCKHDDAFVTLRDKDIPGGCTVCYGPAHKEGKACNKARGLKCKNCGDKHHARNCRRGAKILMGQQVSIQECSGLETQT